MKTAAVSLLLGFNCFKNALISKRIISTYRQRTLRVHFIPERREEKGEERGKKVRADCHFKMP